MEFSQAIARTVCRLQGRDLAAITWEAIGKARMSGMPLTLAEVVVQSPLDLHGQAELPPGFPRSSITGIVTAAGLPSQFGVRVEPFVLLEELEQRLRRLLEAVHSQLRSHRRNRVRDADDLTLGEYRFVLAPEDHWVALEWDADQDLVLESLRECADFRNRLTHFSPDPLPDTEPFPTGV
ncbi:hypothetical protein OHV08_42435 [Streptomyces canus]|uniref:hypothetical protein n=1 Tax=Streptomyces canus TaxID=58343 RepID=UPI003248AC95